MIKNIFILLIFIITNLLEAGFLKPFFYNFLFLNVVVIVVFATNPKFYTQSLFMAFVYGILLNILFASNLFLLPLIFVCVVFVINKLGLWFGEKMIQKLIYVFLSIVILRFVFGKGLLLQILGYEIVFALIYTIIINFLFNLIKTYVDF